jgi:DNA-binding SARP family transcriptional activator/tetratricopeptide (TPR) repeat protein
LLIRIAAQDAILRRKLQIALTGFALAVIVFTMSAPLDMRLLGGFAMTNGDQPVNPPPSPRQQTLLAYLWLHRAPPPSRQQIAFQLWPDSTDAQAQTNLRQLLYHLRRDCPAVAELLQADGQLLQWQPDGQSRVDVIEFEQLLAQAETAVDDHAISLLQTAVSLYRGDLFPDCYEEWIDPHRQRLRRAYAQALQQLISLLTAQQAYETAVPLAERLINHEPLEESGYRQLMQLHALNRNRAAALHTYRRCAAILLQELGVDPSPETQAQYDHILNLETAVSQPRPSRSAEPLPLIGRQGEWGRVQQAWRQAQGGEAHFLLIRGEAGIGKTRLLEELAQWAALQGAVVTQTRAYPAHDHLAYTPLAAWLRSDAFRSTLAALDTVWQQELARLLPELLTDQPHLSLPQPLADSWQRQRFYEALAHVILSPTSERPLLLILDDLQWCDRETLAWLSYLLLAAADRPLLFVATLRSGSIAADHPLQGTLAAWRQERNLTEIVPRPLNAAETAQLVQVVAECALDKAETAVFYRETEGNPLFIVEYARAAQEQITTTPPDRLVDTAVLLPPRVHAVIEARLHQLSPAAAELVELAAVIGREFAYDVLAQASRRPEETIIDSLDELWQRHIIREQGANSYDFSHDKLRAVAYARISQTRRRWLHRQVAAALAARHAANLEPVSIQLATHYAEAGLTAAAIDCYQQAAAVASRVYANADVVELLSRALNLLAGLPAGDERDLQELSLQAALGAPLVALEGYNTRRVVAVYTRILELSDRLGQPSDPRALRGLALARILQGEYRATAALGQQLLQLAEMGRDQVLLVEGHYAQGVAAFWQGNFAQTQTHLEQALAHITPEQHQTHISLYAQNPRPVCLSRLAYTLWYRGRPERAWQLMAEALATPEGTGHPYSLAYARTFACFLALDSQDQEEFGRQVTALLKLSTQHQFRYFTNMAQSLHGYWLARQGEPAAGLRQMKRVLAQWQQEEAYLHRPTQLGWLAQVYGLLGQVDKAQATLAESLALVAERGERYYEAELRRQQAEFDRAAGNIDQAADRLQQALAVAQKQQSPILALRVLTNLVELWQAVGDEVEVTAVRHALQQCYDQFAAGHHFPDLQAARSTLSTALQKALPGS